MNWYRVMVGVLIGGVIAAAGVGVAAWLLEQYGAAVFMFGAVIAGSIGIPIAIDDTYDVGE